MMKHTTTHEEQIIFLRKIEGQIRGIERMIEEGRYCVDIITQMRSVIGAMYSVEDKIFRKHIENCVVGALEGKSEVEKVKKIAEVVEFISKSRKCA